MFASIPAPMIGLIAALAAGLLVGLERGWAQRALGRGHRVAGFRTFGLIGFAGGVAGLMPDLLAAIILLGVVLVLVLGYALKASEDRLSATTTIAGMLTLAIGLAAVRLTPTIAMAAAGGAFILLASRHSTHALLRGLTEAEIEGVARFALVALVILPLLPDAGFGPYEAWNPRRIWMVVVLVAAFSFVGYVAARRYGSERGILVMALTGALVSSTAVTADLARRLRGQPEEQDVLTAGIALASLVMFARVELLTLFLVPKAAPTLALALVPAMLASAAFAFRSWRLQSGQGSVPVKVGNPFDFGPALILAGLVALFSLIARWALAQFGGHGMTLVLALTGMMDVDTAILTLANLPGTALADTLAGMALVWPVLVNTAVKAVMAMTLGRGRAGFHAALPLLASIAATLAGLALYQLV